MSDVPVVPQHTCGCLSGITSRQAVFLELAGLIEAIEWKVCQVRSAHDLLDEPADAEVVERMLKWQQGLVRLRAYCQTKGWSK